MKNMMKIIKSICNIFCFVIIFFGCQKTFLEKKPSQAILQPTTLEEFQSLLDNYDVMNITGGLGVVSADDHLYYSDALWLSSRTATERNAYIWAKDLFEGENSEDWNKPYTTIFYANNVLAGLERIPVTSINKSRLNNVKGWALFSRAYAYFELLSHFSVPFDASTASNDPGVPIRINPSIDELMPRASIEQNYELIFADLHQAAVLLDVLPTLQRNRPSKVAVYALLSRIHLNRREYPKAELYADSCLMNYDKLLDYNTLNKTAATPFSVSNDELIFSKSALNRGATSAGNTLIKIAPNLISEYHPNDLRLVIFFNRQTDGSYRMKRAYHGYGLYPFAGLATDEVYLIKSECLARRNQPVMAMEWLNRLVIKRWNSASIPSQAYTPLFSSNGEDALEKVLLERRKELVWRGHRWEDIKRLNKEGKNIILERTVNGILYTLLPNSPRYTFPIPDNEIWMSGIQQNIR